MDLNGEEKKIQALFCEMKAQDDKLVPPFMRTWNKVAARFDRPAHQPVLPNRIVTFPRLLMAVFILGFLITALIIWPQPVPHQQAQDTRASQAPKNPVQVREAEVKQTSETAAFRRLKSQKRNVSIAGVGRFTGKGPTARANSSQVRKIELSRWQSPTAGLLRFPGDELLRRGPIVTQSAQDMRTFLANLN